MQCKPKVSDGELHGGYDRIAVWLGKQSGALESSVERAAVGGADEAGDDLVEVGDDINLGGAGALDLEYAA
jgi:hypothetical protein